MTHKILLIFPSNVILKIYILRNNAAHLKLMCFYIFPAQFEVRRGVIPCSGKWTISRIDMCSEYIHLFFPTMAKEAYLIQTLNDCMKQTPSKDPQ